MIANRTIGREGAFLRDRAGLLKMRLLALKSKQCNNKANKYYCPEIFLDVVAEKLTSTAVLFLNVELLSEFYYHVSPLAVSPLLSGFLQPPGGASFSLFPRTSGATILKGVLLTRKLQCYSSPAN